MSQRHELRGGPRFEQILPSLGCNSGQMAEWYLPGLFSVFALVGQTPKAQTLSAMLPQAENRQLRKSCQ